MSGRRGDRRLREQVWDRGGRDGVGECGVEGWSYEEDRSGCGVGSGGEAATRGERKGTGN